MMIYKTEYQSSLKKSYHDRSRQQIPMAHTNKLIEFEVQQILDKREVDGEQQYLAVWRGYKEHQATWEPVQFFQHAKKKVRQFQRRHKSREEAAKKRKEREAEMRRQNLLFKTESVDSFAELDRLIKGNNIKDVPIPEVLPKNGPQQPKTFQTFLSRPANELVKVQRFNAIHGKWVQKLQTCAEIVGKNAARQLYRTNAHQDLISIQGISIISGHYTVRFLKDERHYQCELDDLQDICPNEVIDYLLSCYDPSLKKLTEDLRKRSKPLQDSGSNSQE